MKKDDLDSRIFEALPWLIFNFSEMDWLEIIKTAKLCDAQNRLGFLLSRAYKMAKQVRDKNKLAYFKIRMTVLEKSKLTGNDSFQRHS